MQIVSKRTAAAILKNDEYANPAGFLRYSDDVKFKLKHDINPKSAVISREAILINGRKMDDMDLNIVEEQCLFQIFNKLEETEELESGREIDFTWVSVPFKEGQEYPFTSMAIVDVRGNYFESPKPLSYNFTILAELIAYYAQSHKMLKQIEIPTIYEDNAFEEASFELLAGNFNMPNMVFHSNVVTGSIFDLIFIN